MADDRIPPGALALAERLADSAGPILRGYFRNPMPVEVKADDSPVTRADREAEAAMRALLADSASDHGIIGEEFGRDNPDADYVWVLDPLDGTRAFISGKPTFGTLIALAYKGEPILGVIDMPILGERWVGGVGLQTTMNGSPAYTRKGTQLAAARMGATSPEIFRPGHETETFAALRASVTDCNYGGDCYGYALVASGWLDMVLETTLQPYDFAAIAPVIAGAGGVMTDWAGKPLTLDSAGDVLAAGDSALHTAALAVITKT